MKSLGNLQLTFLKKENIDSQKENKFYECGDIRVLWYIYIFIYIWVNLTIILGFSFVYVLIVKIN